MRGTPRSRIPNADTFAACLMGRHALQRVTFRCLELEILEVLTLAYFVSETKVTGGLFVDAAGILLPRTLPAIPSVVALVSHEANGIDGTRNDARSPCMRLYIGIGTAGGRSPQPGGLAACWWLQQLWRRSAGLRLCCPGSLQTRISERRSSQTRKN